MLVFLKQATEHTDQTCIMDNSASVCLNCEGRHETAFTTLNP